MSPEVSIIVPVYQVRPYLERCVNSLLRQSLQEIEIILVDDGSNDGGDQICDHYAAIDDRVRVIHQKNAGLSAARNTGLDLAQAPYIMFVDSDDWVEPDFCRIPWGIARETQVDLVFFSSDTIKKDKQTQDRYKWPKSGLLQEEEALFFLLYKSITVWNKLYSKRIFDEIRFPAGHFCEDRAVIHKLVRKAGKAFYIDTVLYHYCIREGSITRKNNPQVHEDHIKMWRQQYQDLKNWGYQNLSENLADFEAYRELLRYGRKKNSFSRESTERLKNIKGFPKLFAWRQRVMLMVYRFSPGVFDLISILWGKRQK